MTGNERDDGTTSGADRPENQPRSSEPSQQQHHNAETEEDTASGGAPEPE